MASKDPLLQIMAAVYARLGTDLSLAALAPGGVWENRIPTDATLYPAISFALLPTRVDSTFSGPYRWVYDLRITTLDKSESVDSAGAVSERVLALLTDPSDLALPMVDFDVFYCRRASSNKLSPVREGDQYQQLIDGYRLEVKPV